MNIKKVDEKPMVLHTKSNPKIHRMEAKRTSIKGGNILTVERGPKIQKVYAKESIFHGLRRAAEKSRESIKVKTGTLHSAGRAGARAVSEQVEGGEEIRQAASLMYETARPINGAVSGSAELLRQKARKELVKRIKKVDYTKKIAKKSTQKGAKKAAKDTAKATAKETAKVSAKIAAKVSAKAATTAATTTAGTAISPGAGTAIGFVAGEAAGYLISDRTEHEDMVQTTRMRKIRFFLDKMKEEDKQTDNLFKLVKDLIVREGAYAVKKIVMAAAPFLLGIVLLVASVAVPVVAVIGVLYNSPFAIFLPSLESGDTVTTVAASYIADFDREVQALASVHTGQDAGKIIYAGYEGEGNPSNFYDILAVYMIKYGIGDTATIMNDTSKGWLKGVVDDMCSYETSTGSVTTDNADGTQTVTTYLYVTVTLKNCYEMAAEYGFNSSQMEMLDQFMTPEYLALLGFSGGGDPGITVLTEAEIQGMLSGISDQKQRACCDYALHRVGYPYSQQRRHSGEAYDCSSLAYYAWLSAGVDISYGGCDTSSYEAQGLAEAGKTVSYGEMQPGDLIFYSYEASGGYLDITHVAIYVGGGKVVEARGVAYGVVYRDVPNIGKIVMIGRPN